jgi:iron(III) transport system ATP-binding protein
MPAIDIHALTKTFRSTVALDAVDLALPTGAFVALLGPSGCGKTTLLRLLAGFEAPTAGRIAFDGVTVADDRTLVPPEARGVGMVFQSYALWPHMTVFDNVAFPLRVHRLAKAEVAARVAAALAEVGLEGLDRRRPEALSGGQRQRVALARALIQDTGLILADEPLANLDAHLRASLVATFAALHRNSGRTFVYVTHDQAEALALASHVAVMDHGRIVQFADPETVYAKPATPMVARFVGRGTLIETEVVGDWRAGRVPVRFAGGVVEARAAVAPAGRHATVLVRPEAVRPGGDLVVTVTAALYRGAGVEVAGRLADGSALGFDWVGRVAPGDRLPVAIADAWVIPG